MLTSVASTPWVVHCETHSKATNRLFCFPFAGGSAQSFRAWNYGLPTSVEVCPIELPGHGTRLREPLCKNLHSLINSIAAALIPYLDLPFAFFGHSMGAILAFELTRLLRRQYGSIPTHLFVSGRDAPQIKPTPNAILVHNLPESQFLNQIKLLGGVPESVLEEPEMIKLIVPILRADLKLAETYRYSVEVPLECPITAFGGLSDPTTNRQDLEAWQVQTNDDFNLHMLPGSHFFLNSAKSMLLRVIARSI